MIQNIQITQILEMNGMEEGLREQGAQLPIMNILMAQKKKSANILRNRAFESFRKHVICKWYVNQLCVL